MAEAEIGWDDLDAVAVTHGPGLAGSLLVGVNVAKGLAYGRGLPLIGVNHLEAHIAMEPATGAGHAVSNPAAPLQLSFMTKYIVFSASPSTA